MYVVYAEFGIVVKERCIYIYRFSLKFQKYTYTPTLQRGANMKQNNYDISRYDDEYFLSIFYVSIMVWEYIFDGV